MYKFEASYDFAEKMDTEDRLAGFRDRFYIKKGVIYMDGNSMGLCSKDAEKYVAKAMEDWKEAAIDMWPQRGYFLYPGYPRRFARTAYRRRS